MLLKILSCNNSKRCREEHCDQKLICAHITRSSCATKLWAAVVHADNSCSIPAAGFGCRAHDRVVVSFLFVRYINAERFLGLICFELLCLGDLIDPWMVRSLPHSHAMPPTPYWTPRPSPSESTCTDEPTS